MTTQVTNSMLAFDGGAFSFRNKIINGSFDVWQRGTSFTNQTVSGAVQYAADRWLGNRASDVAGQNISRTLGSNGYSRYALVWNRTAGNTDVSTMNLYYALETQDARPLAGNNVVLSFTAKKGPLYSGGNLTAVISYGTGTDEREYAFTGRTQIASTAVTLTTSAQRFQVTGLVPTIATEVGIRFFWTPTGTAGASDEITLEQVQLEVGTVATPFETRPYGVELALCQRYYEKSYALGVAPGTASNDGQETIITVNTSLRYSNRFKVTKRISPTSVAVYSSTTGASGNVRNNSAGADLAISAVAMQNSLNISTNSATTGSEYIWQWTAEAEL